MNVFFSVDLWEFYLPYLYSCISLMGGLLLLSKPFNFFPYTLKKQNTIADVVLNYSHFNTAELVHLIMVFCLTCSVHSCGTVQDVHRHGPVTSEAYSKLYIFMVVLGMVEMRSFL